MSAATVHPILDNQRLFFSQGRWVQVTVVGPTGPGQLTTPQPINDTGWFPPDQLANAAGRITAAVRWTVNTSYFFSGNQFATLERIPPNDDAGEWFWGQRGLISDWWRHWPAGFGDNGIDDAINWGQFVYVFSGSEYIRVSIMSDRGTADPVDPGYPRSIASSWGWPTL